MKLNHLSFFLCNIIICAKLRWRVTVRVLIEEAVRHFDKFDIRQVFSRLILYVTSKHWKSISVELKELEFGTK